VKASEISRILSPNFAADGLEAVADACLGADEFGSFPRELLLVRFICLELAKRWVGPVETHEAADLQQRFAPTLESLLLSISEADPVGVTTYSAKLALQYAEYVR
jgi:hypothetical protein